MDCRLGAIVLVSLTLVWAANAGQPTTASPDTVYDHDVGVANYLRWTHCYVSDTVWFRPLIVNYGRYYEDFRVRTDYYLPHGGVLTEYEVLFIASGDSVEITPLIPYRTFDSAGVYLMFACTTMLILDENPDNNGGRYWAEVTVPDVSIEEWLGPTGDTWPMCRPIWSGIRVANYGGRTVRTWATARFEHACSSFVWMDSAWLELAGGAVTVVNFDSWHPPYVGQYRYRFALTATGDTTPWREFRVVDSVGIEEPAAQPELVAPGPRLWPNPCHGRVWFEDRGPAPLYAPDGRKVAILRPGANELRVTPGIYLVRSGPTAVHRLVVAE